MRPIFSSLSRLFLVGLVAVTFIGCTAWMPRKKADRLAPKLTLDKLYQAPRGAKADWAALHGKVVVLHFWGSWQNASVAAIPHLNILAEQFAGQPVEFIHVTDETNEARLAEFTQTLPIKGWIAIDADRSQYATYGIDDLPIVWLVNGEGKLIAITYPDKVTPEVINAVLEGRSRVPIMDGFHD